MGVQIVNEGYWPELIMLNVRRSEENVSFLRDLVATHRRLLMLTMIVKEGEPRFEDLTPLDQTPLEPAAILMPGGLIDLHAILLGGQESSQSQTGLRR